MSSPATVAAERLIEDVWAGRPPASALGVLQAHISTLRRVLEPDRAPRAAAVVLVTRPPGYAINAVTDARRFARLVARAQEQLHAGDAPAALAAADVALDLWGPPYRSLPTKKNGRQLNSRAWKDCVRSPMNSG